MRHLKAGKKLGRNGTHRLALYRNLTMALIRHERIITTVEKAKAVRPFVEKLITLARKGTLHARRLVASRLGPMSDAEVKPGTEADADHRTVLQKLFADIAPRYVNRPGGYTRVLKRHERRLGDAGRTAFLELLKEGEVRSRAKAPRTAPTPAPQLVETPPPEPEPPQASDQPQADQPPQAQGETQQAPPAAP
jgi:large subunit ribosomal protein L17